MIDDMTKKLISELESTFWVDRFNSVKKLGEIGNSAAVDTLCRVVNDRHLAVRLKTTEILGVIGNERAIDALYSTLFQDDNLNVRKTAANSLKRLGWQPKNSQQTVLYFIAVHEWEKIVELGSYALETLKQLLQDINYNTVWENIKESIEKIYTRLTVVVFGQILIEEKNILKNPNALELLVPLKNLNNIIIDTETYEFVHVESFITYAVNYIGDEKLKTNVEVQIYGDPEKLHKNLRNIFFNLFKKVEEVSR